MFNIKRGLIMKKTSESARKAVDNYVKRHGLIQYSRRIKPEWKDKLNELLKELREKQKGI